MVCTNFSEMICVSISQLWYFTVFTKNKDNVITTSYHCYLDYQRTTHTPSSLASRLRLKPPSLYSRSAPERCTSSSSSTSEICCRQCTSIITFHMHKCIHIIFDKTRWCNIMFMIPILAISRYCCSFCTFSPRDV